MVILYLILGIIASIIGALPLGASNIAVINTTIKQNAKQAFKIAVTAGIAEVILSYYALHCNMVVKDFFDHNKWLQIIIVIALMAVGSYLFFKKKKKESTAISKQKKTSKYITGFVLGILNPPVLIYWIVAFGIINNNNLMLSLQSPLIVLFLFFAGVYFGKLFTLYIYSRFSVAIKNKVQNITLVINKVTGILLLLIGLVQAIKLSF
ncbi:LysE family transporter [uncultured Psychroserpens sp.]|uniref:LysE family transporter n=1 Tax=uncultured Psychroserpens sp. TaxID=255436 RepID=UPI00261FD362|nr:LysE family transporter [uncultured Psychroserpens sp.]